MEVVIWRQHIKVAKSTRAGVVWLPLSKAAPAADVKQRESQRERLWPFGSFPGFGSLKTEPKSLAWASVTLGAAISLVIYYLYYLTQANPPCATRLQTQSCKNGPVPTVKSRKTEENDGEWTALWPTRPSSPKPAPRLRPLGDSVS